MSEHMQRKTDETEDDDLELLRIAALKSINTKKDQPLPFHRSPTTRTAATHSPQRIGSAYSNIPVKQPGNVVNSDNGHMLNISAQPYYPSPVRSLPMSQPRSMHPNVDNFTARQRMEQLDLNEPYVPQLVSGMPPGVQPPHVVTNGVGWMPDPAGIAPTTYTPFASQKVNDSLPVNVNVQLSPRSMAFVAQNNDILMRRKGENISPNYAYRSPSPQYRVCSPHWSKSPSPQTKAVSRSPSHRARIHQYAPHRRSVSRSPLPNNRTRSPLQRGRSISRSPLPPQGGPHLSRHQSPNPFHTYSPRSPLAMRQIKLRSPPMHNAKHKASPQRRRISRSPLAHNGRPMSRSPQPPPNGRRSPTLLPRQNHRGRRSLSPPHNRKRSPLGPHFHDQGNLPPRYHPNRDRRSPVQLNVRRRSASPLPPLPRHRSHSRSPQRRLPRRSRDRNMAVNPPPRRRSPHLNNRRRYEPPTNGFRNNLRGRKRSLSPTIKDRPIRRSRTRSLDRNRRLNKRPRRSEPEERRGLDDFSRNESRRHDERGARQNQNQCSSRRDRDDAESRRRETTGTAPVINNETVTLAGEKVAKQGDLPTKNETIKESSKPDVKALDIHPNIAMDVEKQASTDDEEDNDDDDGIDLFASEDSESENEGRFKSSSNKNERKTQAPTVSFAKLGETRSVEVKELADMNASSNRERERDRNRDRPERSRNNYPGRARGGAGGAMTDHQRCADNGRLSRDRERRNKANVRNGSKNRRDRDRERERERDKERERERERERDRGDRGERVERVDRTERSNRDWDAPLSKGGDDKKSGNASDKPMFKSTFQALENDGKTSRKTSRERDVADRKTATNRRRNNSKDRRASPDHEQGQMVTSSTSGNGLSTTNATATISTSSRPSSPSLRGLHDAGSSTGSKKPIHLRLGAKTNTFKSTKKTPTSPWSGSSHNISSGTGNSNSSKNGSTEKV